MTPKYQLELLMSKHGITKYKLAQIINRPAPYVYDCFAGRRPCSDKQIRKWAEALGFEMTVTIQEKNNA